MIGRDGITMTVVAHKGGGKGGAAGGNSSPKQPVIAPNTLRSRATARILEVLSEGPIKGLVDGLKSVYLDKTPVLNQDGSANFNVPEAYFRNGDPEQDVIPGYPASEAEINVGVELKYNVPVVRRIAPGTDAARLKIRATSLFTQQQLGDVDGATVIFNVEWNIGSAGWISIATVTIQGKTTSPYERSLRVALPKTAQTVDLRITRTVPDSGTSDSGGGISSSATYWPSYTQIVDGTLSYDDTALAAMTIDAQYFPNVPTRGYLLDGILCQVPSNYYQEDGTWSNYATQSADFTNTTAWPRGGAGQVTRSRAVDAASASGYTSTMTTSIVGPLQMDNPLVAINGRMQWSGEWYFKLGTAATTQMNFQLMLKDNLNNGRTITYTGATGVTTRASTGTAGVWQEDAFESVDLGNGYRRMRLTMTLVNTGTNPTSVRIRVSLLNMATIGDTALLQGVSFFPGTQYGKFITTADTVPVMGPLGFPPRYYDGDWDGTFKSAWTDNPAWVLYELATNKRFGTGRDIDAAAIDKWGLYECARYNDEMVPDGLGQGGTEPRFTCNCVINTREDAYKVLNAVAACMRAVLYSANGTIFIVQDRPVVSWGRLFSPANISDGIFDYTGGDYRSRFNAAAVTWNDPSQDYEPAVELVTDPMLISTQPYRDTETTAYGCTVRGQAIRHGRWLIYTNQEESEVVSFSTALENADVRPGDGILIQDPSRAGVRLAGRTLEQPAANQLLFDAPAPGIAPGWKVYVAYENIVIEATVTQVLTESHVAVSGLTGGACPPAAMWLAHDVSIEPTPWRVVAIKENEKNKYEILAAFYSAGKYPYVDDGVRIPPPTYYAVPTGPLIGPTDVSIKEYIYLDPSGVPQFGITLSWQLSTDARVTGYTVELSGPSGDHRRVTNINNSAIDVPAMRQGDWSAYISATDNLGRLALPVTFTFNTVGLSAKPLPPAALYGAVNGEWIDLQWLPTGEIDVLYFWIQYSPATDGTHSWDNSTTIATRISRNTNSYTTPARPGTYLIKTIDSLGQESTTFRHVIIYREVRPPNNIVRYDEAPLWPGTRNLWVLTGGALYLPPPAAPEAVPTSIYPGTRATSVNGVPTRYSYYSLATTFDQGTTGPVVASVVVKAYGQYGNNSMSTWKPIAIAQPLAMGASNNWDAAVEARGSLDGVTWGPWRPFTATTMDVRMLQFRVVGLIYDLQTTLRMTDVIVNVDVYERTQSAANVPIPGSGQVTVNYTKPFYATPNLQLTGFPSGNQGSTLFILTSTKSTFTVEQRKDNGQALGGGSFNWLSTGYGVS
jgi:predicted phage tail protein